MYSEVQISCIWRIKCDISKQFWYCGLGGGISSSFLAGVLKHCLTQNPDRSRCSLAGLRVFVLVQFLGPHRMVQRRVNTSASVRLACEKDALKWRPGGSVVLPRGWMWQCSQDPRVAFQSCVFRQLVNLWSLSVSLSQAWLQMSFLTVFCALLPCFLSSRR